VEIFDGMKNLLMTEMAKVKWRELYAATASTSLLPSTIADACVGHVGYQKERISLRAC
jgi:hypothetical protein